MSTYIHIYIYIYTYMYIYVYVNVYRQQIMTLTFDRFHPHIFQGEHVFNEWAQDQHNKGPSSSSEQHVSLQPWWP